MSDSDSIILDDTDITKLKEYKRASLIIRVFEDPMTGTCKELSIEENFALALRRDQKRTIKKGITHDERAVYHQMIKDLDLGLEDRMISRVGLLSGGQRQTLTLLIATLVRPHLLLLDEHTVALDPKTAVKVLNLT